MNNPRPTLCVQNRGFLSPLDAFEVRTVRPRHRSAKIHTANAVDVAGRDEDGVARDEDDGTRGGGFELMAAPRYHPIPPSPSRPSPETPTRTSPQGFWSLDRLQEQFCNGSEEQQKAKAGTTGTRVGSRRFSDQDIRTRSARASLPTQFASNHKRASASYPIYSPSASNNIAHSGFSPTPPYLPFGLSNDMEASLQRRAASSGSISTRSSFESRTKSVLSISSTDGPGSSRTSLSSTVSFSPEELLARVPGTVIRPRQSHVKDPSVPRYGQGEPGRPLMTPRRLARGPVSPNALDFPRRFRPRVPGEGFRKLPEEILYGILAELKHSHLEVASLSCSTCYARDLISIGASCKKWWNVARAVMYEDVQLVGSDSTSHIKKRFKIKYGTRLKLLRRTLRARPDLADYVKSLKVPAMPETARTQKEKEEYFDVVASVIMACPNLERLPGFYPNYSYEFSRFVYALSTRKKLLERVWMISGNPAHRQYRLNPPEDSDFLVPSRVSSFLLADQCFDFLNLHRNWTSLQTLVMHCNSDGTMNSALFTDIFASLPALDNVHLSNFTAAAFHDKTLLSLPSLKSLRLENLPGITDEGLSDFASPARTDKLRSLSLISLSLDSLPVLARLFSHLKSLTHFTISQAQSPPGVDIFLFPYLASSTLKYIHWEFTNPEDDRATEILARSISHAGFPSLRTIRSPTDLDGQLQKVCRPRDKIELPGDKYRNMPVAGYGKIPSSHSMPTLPSPTVASFGPSHSYTGSIGSNYVKSPTRSAFSLNIDNNSNHSDESNTREKGMSLANARRLAQRRIESAKQKPKFHIIVWDEDGGFLERHAVGGFLGETTSKLNYVMKPDLDGSDESIMGVDALIDDSEEAHVRDGCTGSWNLAINMTGGSSMSGKKTKDRTSHTERGRWKDIPVHMLF
ncbi:hypothetical protein BJ875DRAFT_529881 [Amylocarpus encephaloides]|uniref:F-box domain-containing protein n=1 Tax=Amylocarpus encephaloides TaxID=45428 RepID=A0A9P7YK81_9HELO|nr:hypothetical protein BJ875DRAFT_529881 [Amylocarpus encephaloides]